MPWTGSDGEARLAVATFYGIIRRKKTNNQSLLHLISSYCKLRTDNSRLFLPDFKPV